MSQNPGRPQASPKSQAVSEASVKELRDDLLAYCERMCHSRDEAEDVVQTVFLKSLKAVHRQSHSNERALLRRIAKTTWIDVLRKRSKLFFITPDNLEISGVEKSFGDNLLVEAALLRLIQTLTSKQRAVFLLTEVFVYTNQETADFLGMNLGAVKATLHRARARLAHVAQGDMELESPHIDDEQKAVLRAYVSAFCDADIRRLLELCDMDVLPPLVGISHIAHSVQSKGQAQLSMCARGSSFDRRAAA